MPEKTKVVSIRFEVLFCQACDRYTRHEIKSVVGLGINLKLCTEHWAFPEHYEKGKKK